MHRAFFMPVSGRMRPGRAFFMQNYSGCANRVGIYGENPVKPLSGEAVKLKAGGSMPPDGAMLPTFVSGTTIAEGGAYPAQDRILTENSVKNCGLTQ